MKKLAVGILAHVDAGKTTLTEGLLYRGGQLKKLGRVPPARGRGHPCGHAGARGFFQ